MIKYRTTDDVKSLNYDCIAGCVSEFTGVTVYLLIRYASIEMFSNPVSSSISKIILREIGSETIAGAACVVTNKLVRTGFEAVKKYIIK